jgi:membrane-associated protease RseP (regulator of RpoE activity)
VGRPGFAYPYRYGGFYGGYYPGFAAGLGIGFGIPYYGYGYGGYGYPGYGYGLGYGYPAYGYGTGIANASPIVVADVPATVPADGPLLATPNEPPLSETGLKIVDVLENGSAKQVDLRPGDVILGIGKNRTQSFDALRQALLSAQGEVDLIFLNGETGKMERMPLTPMEGKIGVSVVPIELK